MPSHRTRTFSRRSDAMFSPEDRTRQIRELKKLSRALTTDEIEELRKLINGKDN